MTKARRRLLPGIVLGLLLAPFLSTKAQATCDPAARPAVVQNPVTERERFDALDAMDKYKDAVAMGARWQAFIADAGQDPRADPALLARAHSWLAWSLGDTSRTDEMLAAAQKSEQIYQARGLSAEPHHFEVLANLSMTETSVGKIDNAVRDAEQATALATRLFGPASQESGFAETALAYAEYSRGHYIDAERHYAVASEIAQKCLPPDNGQVSSLLSSHAAALDITGRPEDATVQNERSVNLALANLPDDSPVITLALGNLAVSLRNINRLSEAESLMRRVLERQELYERENWYSRALAISNYATTIEAQGRHEEAESLWAKSVEWQAKANRKDDPTAAASPLRFSADAAQARGDFKLALARREQALALMIPNTPAENPQLALAQMQYAVGLMLVGRAPEARKIADAALAIIQSKLKPSDTRRLGAELGYARIIAVLEGKVAGFTRAKPVIARLEEKLLDTATSRAELIRYGPTFASGFAEFADLALASNHAESAFRAIQLASLSEIVVVSSDLAVHAGIANPATAALVRRFQDHVRLRQGLDKERNVAAGSNDAGQRARLDAAIASNDRLIAQEGAEIDRVYPAFRTLGRPTPVGLAAFQATLTPGQVLLAPMPVADGTLAIAITRDTFQWHKSDQAKPQVDALAGRIRASIAAASSSSAPRPPFDSNAASALYATIVPPALAPMLASSLPRWLPPSGASSDAPKSDPPQQQTQRKPSPMKMSVRHPTITRERVEDAVERRMTSLDNPGFCLCCGAEADGCEPDAEDYECEACGEPSVYGADEIFMRVFS